MEFPETSLTIVHFDEPDLMFGLGQCLDHPKDGLTLYGPNQPSRRTEVNVGVIATKQGEQYFRAWLRKAQHRVRIPKRTARDKRFRPHLSDFPGLTEAFGLVVDRSALTRYTIRPDDVEEMTSIANHYEAVARTADLFLDPIVKHVKNEERTIDVWILVIPEVVYQRCRPKAIRSRSVTLRQGEFPSRQSARSDLPLLADILDTTDESIFDDVPDFHRHIKARLLQYGQPSQLIRETTLAPEQFVNRTGHPIRGIQDPATVAWNLSTALYYKSQEGPPWKLANMRDSVCYIGLVFKLIPNHPDNHACCAAQMFLSEGDGVVFRGANGPWRTEDKEFHLSKVAARDLVETVLETYRSRFSENPRELFIHGRTSFSDDEWDAFREAAPSETNLVAVRIQPTYGDTKLYREGDYPCIRGTAMILGERDGFLWTSGYVPKIDTYLGPETPNPLFVTLLRWSSEQPSLDNVLRDIMALTKINYNAANYNDGLPVTIRFADSVGDVLVMGSAIGVERQPFKYYI